VQRKITHSLKLLANAFEFYGDKVAVASSFGKDSVALIHLARRIDKNVKIFSIMTPFKFEETFEYYYKLATEWELNLNLFGYAHGFQDLAVTRPTDVEECCNHFKVAPTKEAIEKMELEAWVSGLRRTEGTHHRKFTDEYEIKGDLVKINPILDWTEADVWAYHAINSIPPHPLYARGYRSLGCEPCSKPYTEEERGGRWQGTSKCGGECGIHTQVLKETVIPTSKRSSGKY